MILVTGGLGFIGLHVGRQLAANDDVALSYHRSRRDFGEVVDFVGAPVKLVKLNVESPYSLADVLAATRPESVVHLAVPGLGAMAPAEETLTNVTGLVNLLEAARIAKVRRVTIASSVAVYGGLAQGPFREQDGLPVASPNSTSAMKKAVEVLALHYADRSDLDVVLLRIGMVYGPLYHSLANLPSRVLHYAVKGRPLDDWRNRWSAEQLQAGLDLCYVQDCAAAIGRIHLADRTEYRLYNVGGGRAVPVSDVLAAAAVAVPGASFPAELCDTVGDERRSAYMDISRVSAEFGWSPQFSIADGIAHYARWLRDHDL